MDAFDSDVLIYAAVADHELGASVLALLDDNAATNIGSVLLLPELLTKPRRAALRAEQATLLQLLARIELIEVTKATALLAVELGANHGLRAADAVHLATAVNAGADRFITNNRDDFPKTITEVEIAYPHEL